MSTLFMVNPPKRKSRKRRTAKQKAATKKMIAARKKKFAGKTATKKRRKRSARIGNTETIRPRQKKGARTMAKRRRKRTAAAAPRRRRRRSTAKRRSPVTTLRRRSVYLTNPRKRRRSGRKRYRRNPGIVSTVKQGVMDAGATLVGGAVGRIASGMLPLPKTGIAGVAAQLAVAVGVGVAARKVVSADTARFITAGAMQVPLKNLITTFVPQAGAFLGDYDNVGAYALPSGGVSGYMDSGMYGQPEEVEVEIGAYD